MSMDGIFSVLSLLGLIGVVLAFVFSAIALFKGSNVQLALSVKYMLVSLFFALLFYYLGVKNGESIENLIVVSIIVVLCYGIYKVVTAEDVSSQHKVKRERLEMTDDGEIIEVKE